MNLVHRGALFVVDQVGLAAGQGQGAFTHVVGHVRLPTTSIVFRGLRVEVAERLVGAPKHFQFVTGSVAVCVVQAVPVAIEEFLCVVAVSGVVRVNRVVVARFRVGATGELNAVAHPVLVLIDQAVALAIEASILWVRARVVVHGGGGVVVARRVVGASKARFELTAAVVVVGVLVVVARRLVHASAHDVVSSGVQTHTVDFKSHNVFGVFPHPIVEHLEVDRRGQFSIGGELTDQNEEILPDQGVGVLVVDHVHDAPNGVVDVNVKTGFKIGNPVSLVEERRALLSSRSGAVNSDRQPAVEFQFWECVEEQWIVVVRRVRSKFMLVEACGARNHQGRFRVTVHGAERVAGVVPLHVHSVGGHARKNSVLVHRVLLHQNAVAPKFVACARAVFARTVFFRRFGVKVARRVVGAALHFKFVTHPIAVAVVQADTLAIVVFLRVVAAAIVHIGASVVVACCVIHAPFKCKGHGDGLDKHRGVAACIGGRVYALQGQHAVFLTEHRFCHFVIRVGVAVVDDKRLQRRKDIAFQFIHQHHRFRGVSQDWGHCVQHRDDQRVHNAVSSRVNRLIHTWARVTLQTPKRVIERTVAHPDDVHRTTIVRRHRGRLFHGRHHLVACNRVVGWEVRPNRRFRVHALVDVVANAIGIDVLQAVSVAIHKLCGLVSFAVAGPFRNV